jgi:hypothetical protein
MVFAVAIAVAIAGVIAERTHNNGERQQDSTISAVVRVVVGAAARADRHVVGWLCSTVVSSLRLAGKNFAANCWSSNGQGETHTKPSRLGGIRLGGINLSLSLNSVGDGQR